MYTIFKVCADGHTEVKEIGEDLHSLQAEVGGYIEPVHVFGKNDPLLIVNEEGQLLDLPDNPRLPGIKGDGFFIGVRGEKFVSLNGVQLKSLSTLLGITGVLKV